MVLLPGYGKHKTGDDNFGVDWVIHYQFENLDESQAIEEYCELIEDLDEVGLQLAVRHGNGASLLIFVKAPADLVGNWVYKARVRDWLYGITQVRPVGDSNTIVDGDTEAEDLRSINHLVTWQKEKGGAGVTANHGKWENVKASFPLHNLAANRALLSRWSKTTIFTSEDLDAIRALFGEKVAFYFAFTQCYSLFLIFPAVSGVFCWYYCGSYSVTFALCNCLWCVVFVEYWRLKEADLGIRWSVRGVSVLKANRLQYVWDKEVIDPYTGEARKVFSTRKQLLRQTLQIPFAIVSSLALGALIVFTFAMEVFIGEVYEGPFKTYLEFLPTVLFSISLPSINAALTSIATRLSDYENHRTEDQYELAQTQKTFVLNFITAFLPIILTAFVYIPFSDQILPFLYRNRLELYLTSFLPWSNVIPQEPKLHVGVNSARLRQEVIYLTVTAQVLSFGEEMVIPRIKHILQQKYRAYQQKSSQTYVKKRQYSDITSLLLVDHPEEEQFLTRIRNESEADVYNVQDDILEMCIQFGYLTLFGVAWPLVPLGFFLNNWLELRGDFFKISSECQRPPPFRADSIGPWLEVLSFLSGLGTLSTAAIVYLYRGGREMAEVKLWALLLTILVAEQVFLVTRYLVRTTLEKIGSDTVRREEARKYAVRKRYLETFSEEAAQLSRRHRPRVRFKERTKIVTTPTKDSFDDDDISNYDQARGNNMSSGAPAEKGLTALPENGRLNENITSHETKAKAIDGQSAKEDNNDDDGDHAHAPFKGGIFRTDSGLLRDDERRSRFWSAQHSNTGTMDAGVKLIKVLLNLRRSRKRTSMNATLKVE